MENNQIAGLLLSGSAIFAAVGAIHLSIRARRALVAPAPVAAPAPQLMPRVPLPTAARPSAVGASAKARSKPRLSQLRAEPLRTVTAVADPLMRTPETEPGTPMRTRPLRSSVTLLAAISMPLLPGSPVMLPVR